MQRRRIALVPILTLVVATVLNGQARKGEPSDGIDGRWVGYRNTQGKSQRIALEIRAGSSGKEAKVDLPEAGALGIPASNFAADGPHLRFELRGDQTVAVFEGRSYQGSIEGTWREAECRGTFHLQRERTVKPPYREEQVRFENGGVTLAGSLLLPLSRGPHPAIAFVHGSGPEGRHGSRFLAHTFALKGVAALIYDKRGVGDSTGDWRRASFQDLASDVVAAVRYLKTRSEIDAKRIGVMGSSQGGWIAPLAATQSPDMRFVIIKSAAGTTPQEQELARTEIQLRAQRYSENEIRQAVDLYKLIIGYAKGDRTWDEFSTALKRAEGKPWHEWYDLPRDHWYFEHIRLTFDHDPIPVLKRLTCSVLVIFGEKDQFMDVTKSVGAVTEALRAGSNTHHKVTVFPNAGHTLLVETHQPGGCNFPQFAPGYLDLLTAWVKNTVDLKRQRPIGEIQPHARQEDNQGLGAGGGKSPAWTWAWKPPRLWLPSHHGFQSC